MPYVSAKTPRFFSNLKNGITPDMGVKTALSGGYGKHLRFLGGVWTHFVIRNCEYKMRINTPPDKLQDVTPKNNDCPKINLQKKLKEKR
mgnify:CR=1 FL=1